MIVKSRQGSICAVAMLALAFVCAPAMANHLSPNVLVDPSFEDPGAFTTDGAPFIGSWEAFAGSANASSTRVTTMPRTGAEHVDLTIDGDDGSFAGVFQAVAVTPGQRVNAGIWHKTPNTGLLGVGPEFRIEFHPGDAGGEISRVENNGVIPTDEYSLIDIVGAVAPAGATQARIVYAIQTFGGEPDGGVSSIGTVFLDDAAATVIPEPASLALLSLAGLAIVGLRRRK